MCAASVCVFFSSFFLTLSLLFSSHPIFSFAPGSEEILYRALLLPPIFPFFLNVLTSSPSASLSLPSSPSSNLSSLCPSQYQSHWVSASYSAFDPTHTNTHPSSVSHPQTHNFLHQVIAVVSLPLSSHVSSIVCLLCVRVCARAVVVYLCVAFSASSPLVCVASEAVQGSLPSVTGEIALWLFDISVQIKSQR